MSRPFESVAAAVLLTSIPASSRAAPADDSRAPDAAGAPVEMRAQEEAPPLVPHPSVAPEPATAPVARRPAPPAGDVRLAFGYRYGWIDSPGFDTIAADDRLSQLSVETSWAPVNGRDGALSVGVAWDLGSRAAIVSGLPARLDVHRFTAPIEARAYLGSSAYVFGRIAPGAATYQVRVTSPAVPLSGSPWVFATDLSGGVSFLLGPHDTVGRVARAWITPELGYGWATSADVELASDRGPRLVATAPERLPGLALRGAFFRVQLGLTL